MNQAVVRNIAAIGSAILLMCVGGWMSSARAGQGGKATGYAEAERAVTKLEQEWFAIQQANDWAKLSKMISDDFVIVDSDGSLGNKESMVAWVQGRSAARFEFENASLGGTCGCSEHGDCQRSR